MVLALSMVLDLRANVIPDFLTFPGIAYALVLAGALKHPPLWEALVGGLVGGGVVLLIAVVSRGGMGGGDVKLMAMVGMALGWKGALTVLALSQVAGGLLLLGFLIARRRRIPSTFPVGALMALFGALSLLGA